MDCTTPFIGMPEWLMDAWAAEPWGTMDGNWSHSGGQVTEPDMPDAHLQCLDVHSSNLSYVSNNADHATISASSSSLRYPVLAPVIPHLRPHISSNLACDLLDAYFKDHPEQPHVPASPILLTHVFRKSVFLTHAEPRSCTPALLCSMLLVAAVTTEAPFFGASPTARARLLDRLLTTTINLSRSPGSSGATQQASPGDSASPRQYGRRRFVDEVATYLHLALASMVTEVGSFASIWWRTAFQLAKEYRLNADIACRHQGATTTATGRSRCPTSSASGQCDSPYDGPRSQPAGEEDPTLDIEGAIVVDRKDYRFLNASPEEMEERRRIWWTLFVWDKQVALAHNAPVVLTELDCRETMIPIAEEMWQSDRYAAAHHQARDEDRRLSDIFNFLVPFSGVLELMIDQHRAALRTDPAQLDFFQLRCAHPKRQALAKFSEAFDHSINNQSSHQTERKQPWTAYRKFLCRVPLVLDGMSWDMALALQGCTVGRLNAPARANTQSAHLKNIHAISQSLQEVLTIDPDLNMNHLFCDIFLFLSASIVHVMLASFSRSSPAELVHAGEIFVRALESSVSTSRIEHQRKMRRLLLMSLAVAKGSKEVSQVDLDLQQQIITTYRWSAGGYGVGG
ncbi:Xylanolytic transcriptional activator xlnR [Cercospora beticola]|uniref:Xylanolytic transcriptional activator xlnR n=1 Tax=Cercospora beticola TaxID=122368 RepID=A0A2G5I8E3_CERBT|nr:Xylanolytic transcriptional activator xlnR [Cercospora beticola]PIB00764.1 Xylanolytic transcriptional activator xlnR [Cercospora beticola]